MSDFSASIKCKAIPVPRMKQVSNLPLRQITDFSVEIVNSLPAIFLLSVLECFFKTDFLHGKAVEMYCRTAYQWR